MKIYYDGSLHMEIRRPYFIDGEGYIFGVVVDTCIYCPTSWFEVEDPFNVATKLRKALEGTEYTLHPIPNYLGIFYDSEGRFKKLRYDQVEKDKLQNLQS